MIECRPAQLSDHSQLMELLERLQGSRFANYVSSTKQELEAYLLNSLQFPHQCVLLVSIWDGVLCGISAMMMVMPPSIARIPVVLEQDRHCFIHAAYIDPGIKGNRVPLAVGKNQWETMKRWALDRGANFIYGNSRLDGHFDAWARRYGLIKQHVVIGTHLKEATHG